VNNLHSITFYKLHNKLIKLRVELVEASYKNAKRESAKVMTCKMRKWLRKYFRIL